MQIDHIDVRQVARVIRVYLRLAFFMEQSHDVGQALAHSQKLHLRQLTLAHGCQITPPVLMCGGPLTFIPALRKAFKDYLSLSDNDIILPDNGTLLPATGAAIADVDGRKPVRLSAFIADIGQAGTQAASCRSALAPIFGSDGEYAGWLGRMSAHKVGRAQLPDFTSGGDRRTLDVIVGIDS